MLTVKFKTSLVVAVLIGLTLALAAEGCRQQKTAAPESPGTKQSEVLGFVTDCFENRLIHRKNMPLYVFSLTDVPKILDNLRRLDRVRNAATPQSASEFVSLYNELARMVEAARSHAVAVRTDRSGQFIAKNLTGGQEYLVLAINLEEEDAGPFYGYLVTGKLRSGRNTLGPIGPTQESDCRAPKAEGKPSE